jgi:hypothetical protein
MSAATHPASEMLHLDRGNFILGCVIFTAMIALGLLALLRTGWFHRIYSAWLQRFPYPSKPRPSPTAVRLVGALFVLVGTLLLGSDIFEYYFR